MKDMLDLLNEIIICEDRGITNTQQSVLWQIKQKNQEKDAKSE